MLSGEVIQIKTPRNYLLDGLLFGKKTAHTAYIFIHGLGGNLFSLTELASSLVTSTSSVIVFNNRGFGTINRVRLIDQRRKRGYRSITAGSSYEVFSDCVDDIDGAVSWAKKAGAKRIVLVGHSTGCQKSVYYLKKRPKSLVSGAVLLAPMSDLADMVRETPKPEYRRLITSAKKMIESGQAFSLMPGSLMTAQRFLSLFSPESEEEIFSYASLKKPTVLQAVRKPLLVILAGSDEHRDRPIRDIATWFKETLSNRKVSVEVVKGAPHNFMGHTAKLKELIMNWR